MSDILVGWVWFGAGLITIGIVLVLAPTDMDKE